MILHSFSFVGIQISSRNTSQIPNMSQADPNHFPKIPSLKRAVKYFHLAEIELPIQIPGADE